MFFFTSKHTLHFPSHTNKLFMWIGRDLHTNNKDATNLKWLILCAQNELFYCYAFFYFIAAYFRDLGWWKTPQHRILAKKVLQHFLSILFASIRIQREMGLFAIDCFSWKKRARNQSEIGKRTKLDFWVHCLSWLAYIEGKNNLLARS